MAITYAHANIVAEDWKALAEFYIQVFDCAYASPPCELAGDWLARGVGLDTASLAGVNLLLPGHGDNGPQLEIFTYETMLDQPEPSSNRKGVCHLAFNVDDVPGTLAKLLAHGGKSLGEVTEKEVPGAGVLHFVYATDPEGNVVEIMKWS